MKFTETVKWECVGMHPTPEPVIEQLGNLVKDYFHSRLRSESARIENRLRLLDVFAGDGRLGQRISDHLKVLFPCQELTFVEYRTGVVWKNHSTFEDLTVYETEAFQWEMDSKFDLVVCNPPYLRLNAKQAGELGLRWERVRGAGRNVYGLGLLTALEACRAGGLVAAIAPFGWLRGIEHRQFRCEVARYCDEVLVKAYRQRRVFENVSQDIALQLFERRKEPNRVRTTKVLFGYRDSAQSEEVCLFENSSHSEPVGKVRVGTVVWNRKRPLLTAVSSKEDKVPLIYGGNIRPDGSLDLRIPRYAGRQFLLRSAVGCGEVVRAPVILLRRTLRGCPGRWVVDSALITESLDCAVENHVIAIELPREWGDEWCEQLREELCRRLVCFYFVGGSPTVSVEIVKGLLSEIASERNDLPTLSV